MRIFYINICTEYLACWSWLSKYWVIIVIQFSKGVLSEVLSAHDNPVPDFLKHASQRLLSDMLEIYLEINLNRNVKQTDGASIYAVLGSRRSIWFFFQPVWRDLFAVCSLHYFFVLYLLWAFTINLNGKKTCLPLFHINLPRITSDWHWG